MGEQYNLRLVQEFYAAFKRGDITGVLDTLAGDVGWFIPEPEDIIAFVRQREGGGQLARFIAKLTETEDAEQFEPREFIAQRGKVVALGHYRWRVKPTGQAYASDLVHVFTVEDGRVSTFREYLDTHAWAAAYRSSQGD
jgi:uncharacterized protein